MCLKILYTFSPSCISYPFLPHAVISVPPHHTATPTTVPLPRAHISNAGAFFSMLVFI